MSVKALQKQLMAAIAMVLVAAVALGSSTYAWFAANNTVTATGMEVTAKTTAALSIDVNSDMRDAGTTKAAAQMVSATLIPTSTADYSDWFTATAEAGNNYAAKAGTYATATNNTTSENGGPTVYYLANKFYLQVTGEPAQTDILLNSISVTGPAVTDKMNGAFRVAVVCDNEVIYTNPLQSTSESNQVVSAVSGGNATLSSCTYTAGAYQDGTSTYTNATVVENFVRDSIYAVDVYIYFEGEDIDCTSMNAVDVKNYSVVLEFGLGDVTA